MDRNEVIALAREAGLLTIGTADGSVAVYTWPKGITEELERFAALAYAAGAAAELRRLHVENELLRGSLKKANDQAEHFEREWYLRGDEIEDLKKDAERFRFANDSEEDFAICYWDESMGNGGEWMCNGYKGYSIDLLDAAIAKAKGENT